MMQGQFTITEDELKSEYRWVAFLKVQCTLGKLIYLFSRTNLLLGLGILFGGFITPCLQIALAYLYFKKGHMRSRVLNAKLDKDSMCTSPHCIFVTLSNMKQLITNRVLY